MKESIGMSFGNQSSFVVNYCIKKHHSYCVKKYHVGQMTEIQKFYVYGNLTLELNGVTVGNPDAYVSLDTCRYWFADLLHNRLDRDTSMYSQISTTDLIHIFRTKSIVDFKKYHYNFDEAAQFVISMSQTDICEGMDLHSRAYISHVGHNSLDNTILLMVNSKSGYKRFIVQNETDSPDEYIIKIDDIVKGIHTFLASYDNDTHELCSLRST